MSFDAYYYHLDTTGNDIIDPILQAVARAGKGYHHTEDWSEPAYGGGPSAVERIQAAAASAAAEVARLQARVRELQAALQDICDQDPTENALDPQWASRIARAALAAVDAEGSET